MANKALVGLMKTTSTLLIATLSTILIVTIISTCWGFLPALIMNPEAGYIINQAFFFSYWAASVAGIIVLVIGIPVYLVLDKKGKASQINLAIAGFIIPIIILLAINYLTASDGSGTYSSGQNYYGTYRDMVIDNKRTFWGWVSITEQFITYGIYGLIGATVFGKIVFILKKPNKKFNVDFGADAPPPVN